MAAPKPKTTSRPGRALAALGAMIVVIFVAAFFVAPDKLGTHTLSLGDKYLPRLGLDLEGGTSITLQPRATSTGKITDDSINKAVEIIRSRVDSFGVAESEVTAQGTGTNRTIVISIPGARDEAILDRVRQTAELRFRQVLQSAPGTPTPDTPAPSATPTSPTSTPKSGTTPKPSASTGPTSSGSPTSAGRALPRALATTAPATPAAASPAPTAAPSAPAAPATAAAQVTPQLLQRFAALDCSKEENLRGVSTDDPTKPLVTCEQDGSVKYILGRAELIGSDVSGATAGLESNAQGVSTGQWQVNLDLTGEGKKKFAAATTRVWQLQQPENQIAIVLDGLVVSAPQIEEPITGGQARISGGFTQQTSNDLAKVLQYGALPLSFTPGSVEEVSSTLGSNQLTAGLIAGGLGLALVVLYFLFYYRGLGLVAIASLIVAAVANYGLVVLLGWQIGFRLNLAGVTGFIVAIGITADSFIVYFERVRDEVRDGRTLRTAVETGWARARRTTLAADFVSLLAAVTLYVLSVGSVRGFAFTLGLTTLVDVAVVFLFTKPLVVILARTRFFGQGHRFSGLSPERLGAKRPLVAPARRPGPRGAPTGATARASSPIVKEA